MFYLWHEILNTEHMPMNLLEDRQTLLNIQFVLLSCHKVGEAFPVTRLC